MITKSKKNTLLIINLVLEKNHSTIQQIVRIVNDVSNNFNKNLVTVILLLDIEKAFDKVWIDGLIYKMIYYNYLPTLIKYISSYLRNKHSKS